MTLRTLFCTLLLATLSACGAPKVNKFDTTPSRPSDAAFQQLVEAKMPGYVLTSAILGRAVRPSEAYSFERTASNVSGQSRDFIATDFVSKFEETGSHPFSVYFKSDSRVPGIGNYWRLDFAGCAPGNCVAQLAQSQFTSVPKSAHDDYYYLSSKTHFIDREIVSATIDGIDYIAVLYVSFDAHSRVMKYRVSSYREALTTTERYRSHQVGTDRKLRVPTFRFVRNLALSAEAQTWNPSYFGGDGVDVLRGL